MRYASVACDLDVFDGDGLDGTVERGAGFVVGELDGGVLDAVDDEGVGVGLVAQFGVDAGLLRHVGGWRASPDDESFVEHVAFVGVNWRRRALEICAGLSIARYSTLRSPGSTGQPIHLRGQSEPPTDQLPDDAGLTDAGWPDEPEGFASRPQHAPDGGGAWGLVEDEHSPGDEPVVVNGRRKICRRRLMPVAAWPRDVTVFAGLQFE